MAAQKEYTLTLTFKVNIKTDLPIDEAIEEFSSNAEYDFKSTDKVEVINTEWEETGVDEDIESIPM